MKEIDSVLLLLKLLIFERPGAGETPLVTGRVADPGEGYLGWIWSLKKIGSVPALFSRWSDLDPGTPNPVPQKHWFSVINVCSPMLYCA